jgi:hypothetical protein
MILYMVPGRIDIAPLGLATGFSHSLLAFCTVANAPMACSHQPGHARAEQFAGMTMISIEKGEHHIDTAYTHHPAPR